MKNKYYILLLILIFLTASTAFSNSKVGTTGAQFLKIDVGSRSSALGGAYTSVAGDNYNIYYNPAGLAGLDKRMVTAHHNEWITDVKYEFLAYSFNLKEKIVLGFAVQYLHMGRTDKTDDIGDFIGTWTAEDLAINLTYSQVYNENINFGINGKIIRQSNAGYTATAGAIDIGVLFNNFREYDLTYGFSVSNIGTKIKFIKEGDRLPLIWRGGINYILLNSFLLSADIVKPIDNDLYFAFGTEYNYHDMIFVRAGYASNDDIDDGFRAGLGFKIMSLSLDYAFMPKGYFGDSHRFSISYNF